jgi:anti-sigma B factor antagonist
VGRADGHAVLGTAARTRAGPVLMATEFELQLTTDTEAALITVVGELDIATCAELDDAVASVGPKLDITLDLAGVTFIDSTSLQTILGATTSLAAAGRRLVLANPSHIVMRVLTLTGLLPSFELASGPGPVPQG